MSSETDSAVDDSANAAIRDSEPGAGDAPIFPTEDTGTPPADAALPTDYPLPPIPATCTRTANVITYNPNGWDSLADALQASSSPCANYFIHVPAVAEDKTQPRGPVQPAAIRARKGRFFAVAELNYGAWAARPELSWFEKGVEFRKRMIAAGYNVMRGDTWAVHDLPAAVRTDATVRTNVKDLVRGLYSGDPMPVAGIVFVSNVGQETTNVTTYKTALKAWETDGAFFTEMNKYVKYWGQEAYVGATRVCVPGATIAGRSDHVNVFTMHPARLASTSTTPSSVAVTRAFFNATYFPLLTAFWKSTGAYGETSITLDQMKHHVSLEIYATRLYLDTHAYPDGRIGFAWDENAGTLAERTDLATRLANSIRDAYAPAAIPSRACSPTGAYTWCDCTLTGATFNEAWATFGTW